jgi:hypothetical protein
VHAARRQRVLPPLLKAQTQTNYKHHIHNRMCLGLWHIAPPGVWEAFHINYPALKQLRVRDSTKWDSVGPNNDEKAIEIQCNDVL